MHSGIVKAKSAKRAGHENQLLVDRLRKSGILETGGGSNP